MFVEINTLHFGEYDAIATYNKVNITKCEVLKRIGLKPERCMINALLCIDNERERDAERKQRVWERQAKQNVLGVKRKLEEDMSSDSDNPSYGAGLH